MKFTNLSSCHVSGKLVLLRIDVNSAVYHGRPLDEPRFSAHGKTIKWLSEKNARIVILAHQGRKGDKDYLPSLKEHAKLLSKHSGINVEYVDDLFGKNAEKKIEDLNHGEVILLKNVRAFEDEDEDNVEHRKNRYYSFSKKFDLYVNDALSVCHRNQGSVIIPPRVIMGVIGFNLESELRAVEHFSYKDRKMVIVLGGEKVQDLVPALKMLENENVSLLASGVLGNLLLIASGADLGYEDKWLNGKGYYDFILPLREILNNYRSQIVLPVDFALAGNRRKEVSLKNAPFKKKIMDVGKKTVKRFIEEIEKSDIVFMKGPLGFSEMSQFKDSTVLVLKEISRLSKQNKIYSLLGGGHLTTTVMKYKIQMNFSHVSLSGGALIRYLSGEELPGLEVLER